MNKTRARLLKTFNHMRDRCYNENCKSYKNYGARGISICSEWLNDKERFVEWSMNNGYKDNLTIDRIDNDGNYEPENCRWVTISENNQNRRSSKFYTIGSTTKNLQQWCNEYGIDRSTVNRRLSLGWDIEKALSTSKRKRDTKTLIGKRYGKLTVLDFYGVSTNRDSKFKCLCDCGNTVIVQGHKLISGHTKSCGCLRKENAKKLFGKHQQA